MYARLLSIAVLLKKGIIVGIEQNITLQPTLGLLQFRLITKVTHEYFFQLLRRMNELLTENIIRPKSLLYPILDPFISPPHLSKFTYTRL